MRLKCRCRYADAARVGGTANKIAGSVVANDDWFVLEDDDDEE
jgi:hypothetical protein